jgi:hypothetical protein
VLAGLSSIPAAGDEHAAGGEPGPPAAARPPLLALLRSRARVADEISARLLRILDRTKGIADEVKHRIRGSVASSVAEAAPYLTWRSILHSLGSDYYLLRLTAALAALPVLFVSLLPEIREAGRLGLAAPVAGLLLVAAAVAGLLVGVGLTTVLIAALRRFGGRVAAFAATAALLALAAGGLGAALGRGSFVATMQRGLWASAIFFASFLVIAQGLYLAQVLLLRLTIRRVPQAEVVTSLLVALVAAEAPEPNPTDVANQLQQLADTMRRALPGRFPGAHPDTEHLLREEARSIAAAVHRMSVEVLLGGKGAQAATLVPKLGEMLVHVAEEDWASLERADPKVAGPARRLVPGLPAIVVAAVPLLLGLGLRSGVIPLDADAELVDSLVRFGVVWAVLHALTALDPQATDKIDRTERLLQRLP